ncbi:MAG: hypothetical protein AB1814_09060 [Thermodesulfobacteriota bacterium]
MATKLHINIFEGIIDVDGDEGLVQEIYRDLKPQIIGQISKLNQHLPHGKNKTIEGTRQTEESNKTNNSKGVKKARTQIAPKQVSDLNLEGLSEFYDQFAPKGDSERILIFLKYLQSKKNYPSSMDSIFTCFMALKTKLPKDFGSALRTTRNPKRYGYIAYESYNEITITSVGENHFNFSLARSETSK